MDLRKVGLLCKVQHCMYEKYTTLSKSLKLYVFTASYSMVPGDLSQG
jgi:hypothetical protein